MIISHRYKFIFLKTNKTAGTSIEIALTKFCGPEDVITPISPEDESIRKLFGYIGAQNYFYDENKIGENENKSKENIRFYNHITAKQVREEIGDEIWKNYYKFCVERNPWDRAVSLYFWRYKTEPRPKFSKFIKSNDLMKLKKKGQEIYTINGQVAVDKICRYEDLTEELENVRKHLGIPERLDLPQAKSQFRKNKQDYRNMYGKKEIDRIAKLFSDEIDLMGYTF